MLSVGLVGLPNAGKSTLFNLLTKRSVPAENFPFTTIDPNDGIVEVPDARLKVLSQIVSTQKEVYAAIEFRDIAGLIKNAHAGEGLGNQFLSHIKEVNMILLVIRRFQNDNITHVENRIQPQEDEEILLAELVLHDEKTMSSIIQRLQKESKKDPKGKQKLTIASEIMKLLETLKPASDYKLDNKTDEELIKWRRSLNLLSDKPILRLGNINYGGENVDYGSDFDLDILMEKEMEGMESEEREEFGAPRENGVDGMIRACFKKLNLSTYFTAGVKEARAWTYTNGWKAPQCAGVIHTDFEKKFVKAEVIKYDDFVELGGRKGAIEKGKMRQEGKEYAMQDGDVVEFVIGN